ncbi:MAG TPA: flap endonuclease-1 [Acidobacteriota bacterium]|nr:flap endonuclease-1 [Acidobacteriota bacterium]
MGVALTDFVEGKAITLDELSGKTIAIDAFNFLYQFLAVMRGPDGSLLTDSKGNVTSHLVGLFARTTKLMQAGIKCVYVFDGEHPELKSKEIERRSALKAAAQKEYNIAKEREDIDGMKKFASRTMRLTPEMVVDAKALLVALGVPVIQAPSEGEAQAAIMAKRGDVDFIASQDTDALLFGAPKVVRNLSILGRRKKVSKVTFEYVSPQVVTLSDVLNELGIDRKQLIVLSILVGTDFNVGGIKGIGPKTALKMVKSTTDYDVMFAQAGWEKFFTHSWHDVYDLFENMPAVTDYKLEWKPVNEAAIIDLLVGKFEFNADRVKSTLADVKKKTSTSAQKGLNAFFG